MLEKWKLAVNSNEDFGALLIDLLKAFDCINHTNCEVAFLWLVINILKLHSYGLSLTSLRLISNYLSNRKQ